MCGRYAFAPTKKQQQEQLKQLDVPENLIIRYNIAPTQDAYIITNDAPERLQLVQWGLIPNWSPDGKNQGKLINARAESISEKPSFAASLRHRRCLVPADSFYEWRKAAGGKKEPYRIFLKNGELLFMAGIWDRWGPEQLLSFSIITTKPNLEMTRLHNRMPVLLTSPEMRNTWLSDISEDIALNMLQKVPDGILEMYRVSEKLNGVGLDTAQLQEKVPESLTLFEI
jgi:putative SOS response-associated peptidase YedK